MMKYFGIIFCLFFSFFFTGRVSAQTEGECKVLLDGAEEVFRGGNPERVYGLIKGCLNAGAFGNDDLKRAYKLMTIVSVFEDDRDQAISYMGKFLKLDPEYEISTEIDPAEFVDLYDEFNTLPVVSIGLLFGPTWTMPSLSSQSATYNESEYLDRLNESKDSPEGYKKFVTGFQVGLKVNKYLHKRIGIEADLVLKQRNVKFFDKAFQEASVLSTSSSEYAMIQMEENQWWIDIPVRVSYDLLTGRFRPFVGIGAKVGYLVSDQSTFTLSYDNESLASGAAKTETINLKEKDLRYSFNYWLLGEIGVKYKIPKAFVGIGVRYAYGLRPVVKNYYGYDDTKKMIQSKYFYKDDLFSLNSLNFLIYYSRNIYNPKIKKSKE